MSVRFIIGDTLDVLQSMPAASVDLVLSSPPFLALRSYLPSEHPDKAKEIGSEPTPGHGRSAVGIDLDERNGDLARERVGMWLEVERHTPDPVEVA